MNKRLLMIFAFTLCVGALLFPMTAHAASDSTPPKIDAWLEGEILHAEASDRDSGVEAVYVNGHRFGYLVDGAVEVSPLKDYAGKDEFIVVHAVDYAGNKSAEVKLKNPYYTAPSTTPTQTQTTPAPDPTPQPSAPAASQTPPATSGSTSRPSTTTLASSSTPEPQETTPPPTSESAVPDDGEANPFTPDGTGSVQDNATEQDGKEFFTIVTEEENTFYLIIDRQRDSNGVYLLNAVTEDDLMALAEKSGDGASGESAVPTPTPDPTPQPQPDPTPEPEPEPEEENGGMGAGPILIILLAVLGVGGAGYYFKIMKPKRDAAMTDDEDEDDSDYDDEPDYPDDSDDYDEYGIGDDEEDDQ